MSRVSANWTTLMARAGIQDEFNFCVDLLVRRKNTTWIILDPPPTIVCLPTGHPTCRSKSLQETQCDRLLAWSGSNLSSSKIQPHSARPRHQRCHWPSGQHRKVISPKILYTRPRTEASAFKDRNYWLKKVLFCVQVQCWGAGCYCPWGREERSLQRDGSGTG